MDNEDGWLKRRVALAANEFDSWPESFKDHMRLNGPEPDKNKALAWLVAENDQFRTENERLKGEECRLRFDRTAWRERADESETEVTKLLADLAAMTAARDKAVDIAIREREWRLEESECGGDEVSESVGKLKAELAEAAPSAGEKR